VSTIYFDSEKEGIRKSGLGLVRWEKVTEEYGRVEDLVNMVTLFRVWVLWSRTWKVG
jgi:hypothetical protein